MSRDASRARRRTAARARDRTLAIAAALLLAPAAVAVEVEGLEAPDRIVLQGHTLQRNGIGIRSVTRLLVRVDIYVAALYVETPSSDAEQLLASDAPKQIDLRYLYPVDAADMRRAWAYSFEQSCPGKDCGPWQPAIDGFLERVRAVEPGDTYVFRFFADRVEIVRNGGPAETVRAPGFASLLLATWIGNAPPTEELKRDLLGG